MVVRVRLGTPIYMCFERTRKGGTENGLVDHFPDAACRVRLGTPLYKEKPQYLSKLRFYATYS